MERGGGTTGGGGGSTAGLNVEFVTGDCWFPLLASKRGRGCPKVGKREWGKVQTMVDIFPTPHVKPFNV